MEPEPVCDGGQHVSTRGDVALVRKCLHSGQKSQAKGEAQQAFSRILCELHLLAEKADNALHTARLPLPPEIHVEGLKGALVELEQRLRELAKGGEADT